MQKIKNEQQKISSARIEKSYRQTINAKPDVVFPLLCPVREVEWLEGWDYRMVYSQSGLVEQGAVFTTSFAGEEDTIWVVSNHDKQNYVVEFTRFTPASRTCFLRIQVQPRGPEQSFVDISYSYTALTPAGEEFINSYTEEVFIKAVRFWEDSMNYYLKTGKRLKSPG